MAQKIRIIAGALGGRLLEVPEEGTRPFADRVRQALFAILEPRLLDARVLDLCAGSGAAGLEALSRGAQHVQFVEISRRATDVIRRNVASLGLAGQTEIQTSDALASLRALLHAEPPLTSSSRIHRTTKCPCAVACSTSSLTTRALSPQVAFWSSLDGG